jgi:voltage-gated potassium channel
MPILNWFKRFKANTLLQNNLQKKFISSSLYLLIIFILHITAMIQWENLHIYDAIWLTFTTITTVGYGDLPIETVAGRLATIILLYLGGIFVLAKTAGDYFDYRVVKSNKQIKGEWRWDMNNHIVLISNNEDHIPILYYQRLVNEFQQTSNIKNMIFKYLPKILKMDYRNLYKN